MVSQLNGEVTGVFVSLGVKENSDLDRPGFFVRKLARVFGCLLPRGARHLSF